VRQRSLIQVVSFVLVLAPSILFADQRPVVQFDLPPTAAATAEDQPDLVSIELRLSSMIETPEPLAISQWVVRCIPRDQAILIADYAPRTETASDLATPIQIKQTAEESKSAGISIDAAYGHLTRANVGSDHGKKNSDTIQYDRVAPLQAVTAAGTIQRGRGVYFKLRWTATQVLEGEKTFCVTMRVPPQWRGGLLDVSVVAQAESQSLAPWDRDPRIIGQANFVVAAFRSGDAQAEQMARTVSEAELTLRELSKRLTRQSRGNSLPTLLHQLATKLDLDPRRDHSEWVQRLVSGKADPYLDKQIRKMPMPIRVAVLEYVDRRIEFTDLKGSSDQSVIAAKPAL
jgi:regulator of extracellular matrix RemA (YlzA/DUF370 family)